MNVGRTIFVEVEDKDKDKDKDKRSELLWTLRLLRQVHLII